MGAIRGGGGVISTYPDIWASAESSGSIRRRVNSGVKRSPQNLMKLPMAAGETSYTHTHNNNNNNIIIITTTITIIPSNLVHQDFDIRIGDTIQ